MEEFNMLSEDDQAEVLQDIVQELAIETQLPISVVLQMVAKHYQMKLSKVKKLLKIVNSAFIQNNNIIMYVQGEPIYRTNSNAILFRSLSKLKICFDEEETVDVREVRRCISDYYSQEEGKKHGV